MSTRYVTMHGAERLTVRELRAAVVGLEAALENGTLVQFHPDGLRAAGAAIKKLRKALWRASIDTAIRRADEYDARRS